MPEFKPSVGVLFILASMSAIAGGALLSTGSKVTGALLEVVLAVSVVAIAALLLPVLRHSSEGGAVLYVAVRTLEAGLILSAVSVEDRAYHLGTVVIFAVSAVVLNTLLLRGRQAPPWLAWWGLAGGVLLLARGVIELYGPLPAGAQAALAAPIGIQEMVFAVWLIAHGRRAARPSAGTAPLSPSDQAATGACSVAAVEAVPPDM